jgi:hypothetical protein
MNVEVLETADSVAQRAAAIIADEARVAVAARGVFVVAVSGGHTPWLMLSALAFKLGAGPRGIWWGETCGLTVVVVSLALRFHHRVRPERLAVLQVG